MTHKQSRYLFAALFLLGVVLLAGCSAPGGPYYYTRGEAAAMVTASATTAASAAAAGMPVAAAAAEGVTAAKATYDSIAPPQITVPASIISLLGGPIGVSSLITLAAGTALNAYRNRTRGKDLEVISSKLTTASQGVDPATVPPPLTGAAA